MLLEMIKESKLIKLESTGHEIHFEDWNTIADGIDNHVSGR
ncbi:hypothetical protein [Belliella filtrata]|nr:hypothetical protein [Belliella filtrata]